MEQPFKLMFLVLAIISFSNGQEVPPQARSIGEDDPCAEVLGVSSPSDNLSCEFSPSGTICYNRTELCNGEPLCVTGSDEGFNIAALDCKSIYHTGV